MTTAMINEVTFWVWVGKWPVWLAWELFLLRRRRETVSVKTLSQVAQRRAWQLNSAVYADAGLFSHFVWNTASWAGTVWTGVAFWAPIPLLLVFDVRAWKTPRLEYTRAQRWTRFPLLWAVLAVLAAHLLFPQVGPSPWNWTNVSW